MALKRIFIAINIPKKIKDSFEGLLNKIPTEKMKPVRKDNLHITLKFLGYMTEEEIENIYKKLLGLRYFDKFEIGITGIGSFKNRILWADISKGSETLEKITGVIEDCLHLNREAFRAHLTLARNKKMSYAEFKQLEGYLKGYAVTERFVVESIDIMESVLGREGPSYSTVKRIMLNDQ